jgi:hypothetical protein
MDMKCDINTHDHLGQMSELQNNNLKLAVIKKKTGGKEGFFFFFMSPPLSGQDI